jgi:hypothetical protein
MLHLGHFPLLYSCCLNPFITLQGAGWWRVHPGNGESTFAAILGSQNWLNGTTIAVRSRAYLWERKQTSFHGPLNPLGSALPAPCTWHFHRERMSPVSRMCGGRGFHRRSRYFFGNSSVAGFPLWNRLPNV